MALGTAALASRALGGVRPSATVVGSPSLVFVQQPTNAASGATVSPAVTVKALAGDGTTPVASVSVTVALSGAGGTLAGTLTATTNGSGIATFSTLAVTRSATGSHTLTATASTYTTATSASFTVRVPALTLTTAPTSPNASGSALATSPVVQLTTDGTTADTTGGVVVTATLTVVTGSESLTSGSTATTNSSGTATFGSSVTTGNGTFTLTFSASGYTSVTSPTVSVAAYGTYGMVDISVTPSLFTAAASDGVFHPICPKYGRYLPAGVVPGGPAVPLTIFFAGAGQMWNGLTPGNIGVQASNAASCGYGDVVLQMCGQSTYYEVSPAWVEGDWPGIGVLYQLGNTSFWTATNQLQTTGWAASAIRFARQVLLDLAAQGYTIDPTQIHLEGISAGAQAAMMVALDDVLHGPGSVASPTYAHLLGGTLQCDARGINYVAGTSFSDVYSAVGYLASKLKNLPITATAGQEESPLAISPDRAFTQASNSRDIAVAFRDPANVGTPIPNLYWYLEYERGGGGTDHLLNYGFPSHTTAVRDRKYACRRGAPEPVWQRRATVTLKRVQNASADITDGWVSWDIVVDGGDATYPLPDFYATGVGSGVRRADGNDVAVYTDLTGTAVTGGRTFTGRLKLFKRQDTPSTGVLRGTVGTPPGFGVGLSDVAVTLAWGCPTLNYNLNADGRLAFDYRLRRAMGFGDGVTLAVADDGPVIYPDHQATLRTWAYPFNFTTTNSPTTQPTPIGGALVSAVSGSKRAAGRKSPWYVRVTGTAPDSATVGNIHGEPMMLLVVWAPIGTPGADQSLATITTKSSATRTLSLVQGASGAVRLKHGGVTLTSSRTFAAGAYNLAAAILDGPTLRSIVVNPAGVAGTYPSDTDTTDLTGTLFDADEFEFGHAVVSGGATELADAAIPRVYALVSMNTDNRTVGRPGIDWLRAMDWMRQGAGVAYTFGAQQALDGGGGGGGGGTGALVFSDGLSAGLLTLTGGF